jgi:hypothetical protein
MRTAYVENPGVPGTVLYNGADWQVTELIGGLCCELLFKERGITRDYQREENFSDHDCYPSVLLQGDEAAEFLLEFNKAEKAFTPADVGRKFLQPYLDIVRLPIWE